MVIPKIPGLRWSFLFSGKNEDLNKSTAQKVPFGKSQIKFSVELHVWDLAYKEGFY